MKKRKVEAWAVASKSGVPLQVFTFKRSAEAWLVRYGQRSDGWSVVRLVPADPIKAQLREAMKVVRAAQRAVNRGQMGPCNCNERQCRLRQAVSRFEKQRTKRSRK